MFYVRPVTRDYLPAAFLLSERTGAGLTTLPANRDRLAQRIERSLRSFALDVELAEACYVFVLADSVTGDVAGICGVEAAVGLAEPRHAYRVGTPVPAPRTLH